MLVAQVNYFDSTIFMYSKPFCEQKVFEGALVLIMLFTKFFLSFLTINEENASCVDGEPIETFLKVFFTLFKRLTLFSILLVRTWPVKSAGFPLIRSSSWSVIFSLEPPGKLITFNL